MKTFTGKVISTKMPKTASIVVDRIVVHPIYKKRLKKTKKYHVHDDLGVEVGQIVRFVACKPYSKSKKWRIIEKVEKGDKKSKSRKKSKKKIDTKES